MSSTSVDFTTPTQTPAPLAKPKTPGIVERTCQAALKAITGAWNAVAGAVESAFTWVVHQVVRLQENGWALITSCFNRTVKGDNAKDNVNETPNSASTETPTRETDETEGAEGQPSEASKAAAAAAAAAEAPPSPSAPEASTLQSPTSEEGAGAGT